LQPEAAARLGVGVKYGQADQLGSSDVDIVGGFQVSQAKVIID